MRMKTHLTLLVLSALVLSACGGNELAEGQEEGGVPLDELEEAAMAGPDGPAPLRCPAKVRKELSGPDIIGLRLGMTLPEAMATTRCSLGEEAVVTEEYRCLYCFFSNGVAVGTQFFTVENGSYRPCNFAS